MPILTVSSLFQGHFPSLLLPPKILELSYCMFTCCSKKLGPKETAIRCARSAPQTVSEVRSNKQLVETLPAMSWSKVASTCLSKTNRQSKQTINNDLLKIVNFLSACKASSRVKGKSNQRALVIFSCMVRPNISKYEGALSIACVPIWIRMPVITIVLLLFVTSMVKPPGCRRQITKAYYQSRQ